MNQHEASTNKRGVRGNAIVRRPSSRSVVVPSVALGSALLILAYRSNSLILGLVGLGFFFLAFLFHLTSASRFFREEVLASLVESSLSAIEKLLDAGGYKGRGIYLPAEGSLGYVGVFVPKEEALLRLPDPHSLKSGRFFIENPAGVYLRAPGLNVLELFERLLNLHFRASELHYALSTLSKVFTELEISLGFDYFVEGDYVRVKLDDLIGRGFCAGVEQQFPGICERVGCPFCSAIACAISESTGRPVLIESISISPSGRSVESVFRMLT